MLVIHLHECPKCHKITCRMVIFKFCELRWVARERAMFCHRGHARLLISHFPSVTNSPTVIAWPGNGWTEDDARPAEPRDGTRCPPHMVLCADIAACLSYHLLTTLLISYVFACGINNVYLEKIYVHYSL